MVVTRTGYWDYETTKSKTSEDDLNLNLFAETGKWEPVSGVELLEYDDVI